MVCPSCRTEMMDMTLEGRLGKPIAINVCANCQAFWFDQFESLQLSPGSTLQLMKFIGEHSAGKPSLAEVLRCPRCPTRLRLVRDLQRNTRFSYWRCGDEHGRFIGFFEFLKEKDFIRPLTAEQIEELRTHIQIVNCSNCGAAIDLESGSACTYCRSPVSMLDMKQPRKMLAQLKQAAGRRPVDPMLPAKLAMAKLDGEALGRFEGGSEWWSDAQSGDMVHAGLNTVARWLTNFIV